MCFNGWLSFVNSLKSKVLMPDSVNISTTIRLFILMKEKSIMVEWLIRSLQYFKPIHD